MGLINNPDDFYDFYEKYSSEKSKKGDSKPLESIPLEKGEYIDLESGLKTKGRDFVDLEKGEFDSKKETKKETKKEKPKVKIEPVVKETMSDIKDRVEVKDVLDKIVNKIEKPEKITIKKSKSKSKKSDESEKIVQGLFDEILKDVDEMQKKQEEKEAKRKSKKETKEMQTQTDSPKKSKEIQTQTEKETKEMEIQTSHYDIDKEDRKQKKITEKERKEMLENIIEKKLEEEGKKTEKKLTIPEIEDNFEYFLGEHFEGIQGMVKKESKIKDIELITNYINTIIEDRRGTEALNKNLKKESESIFKDKILQILETLDISENDLLTKFFNKKASKNFSYSNLVTIKKGIVKFQKSYRLSDIDTKQDK